MEFENSEVGVVHLKLEEKVVSMNFWISMIGYSPFAVINTLWAACSQDKGSYVPDKVFFLVNKNLKSENITRVHVWAAELLKAYGVADPVLENVEIEEDDFEGIENTISSLIEYSMEKGNVAVDITPGRKFMSAIAMYSGIKKNARHVYYLHLKEQIYENEPFPLIPMPFQKLFDLKKEGVCCE